MKLPDLNELGLDMSIDDFWEQYLVNSYEKKLRSLVEKTCKTYNITNSCLRKEGVTYLLNRTHILRYFNDFDEIEKNNLFDLLTCILFSLFISGEENELIVDGSILTKDFYILEGTNLCFDFLNNNVEKIKFIPTRKKISFSSEEVMLTDNAGNYIFSSQTKENKFLSLLPYDPETNFIFFYMETDADLAKYNRYLISDLSEIRNEIKILRQCRKNILSINPFIWDRILSHIVYINFTKINGFESSTNPRELRSSIVINMHFNKSLSELERVAWVSNGLYHEAKHNQFIDSIYLDIAPDKTDKKYLSVLEKKEMSIIAPWKGLPQSRTLTQILLGLHAFIPGLFICFKILSKDQNKPLSSWIENRIEMEMRSTNGNVSIAILSETYLNDDGLKLSSRLVDDFFEYLYPSYVDLTNRADNIQHL